MNKIMSFYKRSTALALMMALNYGPIVQASTISEQDDRASILRQSIEQNLRKTDENLKAIDSRTPAVVVVGRSGAGKSTLINALAERHLEAKKILGEWKIKVEDPLPGFAFSDSSSATRTVTPWQNKDHVVLDCAGFEATQGDDENVINAYSLRRIFDRFSNAKLLLVVDWPSIVAGRSQDFTTLLKQIVTAFPQEEELFNALSLVITKLEPSEDFSNIMVGQLKKIQAYPDLLNPSALRLVEFLINEAMRRIASFPLPQREGRFEPNIEVEYIRRVINQAQYVNKLTCHVSIPAEAALYVGKLAGYYSNSIEAYFAKQGDIALTNYFLGLVDNHPGTIGSLRQIIGGKLDLLKALAAVHDPEKFIQGVKTVLELPQIFALDDALEQLEFLKSIKKDVNYTVGNWYRALSSTIHKLEMLQEKPTVQFSEPTGALTITGLLVGLSDLMQARRVEYQHPVREISVYALNSLILDEDLKLPGEYLTLIAPTWRVIGQRLIDVSGKDAIDNLSRAQAGSSGVPGAPGGNGGHIYTKGYTFKNLSALTLKTDGGRGGKGQDGANGVDGVNGADAPNNISMLVQNGNCYSASGRQYIHGGGGPFTISAMCYRLSGKQGTPGGNSQKGGAGGLGGKEGLIYQEGPNGHIIRWNGRAGAQGSHGQPGIPGKGGVHGKNFEGVMQTDNLWFPSQWCSNNPYMVTPSPSKANDGQAPAQDDVNMQGQQPLAVPPVLSIEAKKGEYQEYYEKVWQELSLRQLMKKFSGSDGNT